MANDGAGSIHAVRMRVARLSALGAPLAGAGNTLTSEALVRFRVEPVYEDGDEKTQKNGQGTVCLTYKAPDTLKRANLTLEVCTPDPHIAEFLAGGDLITSGAEVVGYAAPRVGTDPNPNGVSIELWSRAVTSGGAPANPPYRWWALPRTKWKIEPQELSEDFLVPTFTGTGEENDQWGDGPANDWAYTSDRVWQWVRTGTIPAASLDPTETAAQPEGAVQGP